jgi:Domain of unknown function (DUF4440)
MTWTMKTLLVALVCGAFAWAMGLTPASNPGEEKRVLATLEALSQATLTPDSKMVAALLNDDVSYGHTSGEIMTKAVAIEHILSRKTTVWKWTNPKVTVIGPTALVRATQTINYIMLATAKAEVTATDKPLPDGTWLRASSSQVLWVLVKGNGPHGWQIAARQNFRPDPLRGRPPEGYLLKQQKN